MNAIIDTLARVLVSLFDGVKQAVEHANPSIFALIATLLPFALPLPVAFMTAHSAQKFFSWDPWAANVLGYGLEGLGLLAWVKFVDAILEHVKSKNPKVSLVILLYAGVSLVYEILLIFVNVILARQDGAGNNYVVVLTCICLLPALSAMLYGHQKQAAEYKLTQEHTEAAALAERERIEAKEQAERERQERREDRKELARLKLQYNADAPAPHLEDLPNQGGKFPRKKSA